MEKHELERRSALLHIAASHADLDQRKKAMETVRQDFGMSDRDIFLNTKDQYIYAAVHRIEEKLNAVAPASTAASTAASSPAATPEAPATPAAPFVSTEIDPFQFSAIYRVARWLWSLFN
jgi:hydroxyacyl-ACP dehydratase HTD2-like protein with hotdog domain